MKYPLNFKAAVLEGHNKPLAVDTVTFEGPLQKGQVLVKIHYSGICGKQIEEIQGTKPDPFLPHMLGHEGSGIVVDTGPGVKKVSKGDHVVLHWLKGSGIDASTPLYSRKGKRVNAGWITTFNEYGVISENRITPIPKDTDLRIACLLGCAVTTGIGVVLNEAKLKENESIAIFGCGGVGLNAIQGAKLSKGYPIIAVDKNPGNLAIAKKFGATHFLISDSKIIEEIRKITGSKGAKYVIIALGNPKAVETAVEASSIPGTVYFVGVPPAGSKITIDPFKIHMLRKLVGSCGGATFPDEHIPSYLGLYKKGDLKLDELVSLEVTLDNINQGINKMSSGINGRCIVSMNHSTR
ncbi:zinc-binding dehydrogenase [Candidatus Woesearchaeota archaeon]|nr:zinc-binding dehydrogenase [Candidatus Woesearchaeota archaeon]